MHIAIKELVLIFDALNLPGIGQQTFDLPTPREPKLSQIPVAVNGLDVFSQRFEQIPALALGAIGMLAKQPIPLIEAIQRRDITGVHRRRRIKLKSRGVLITQRQQFGGIDQRFVGAIPGLAFGLGNRS